MAKILLGFAVEHLNHIHQLCHACSAWLVRGEMAQMRPAVYFGFPNC